MSTCFRKEAGAHGKDTWGIFRVHQFEKVEQFCICEGDLEKSAAMQDEMVRLSSLSFTFSTVGRRAVCEGSSTCSVQGCEPPKLRPSKTSERRFS